MSEKELIEFLDKHENISKMKSLKSGEEIQKYLKDNGIEIDVKKAEELKKMFELIEQNDIELSNEELENISGGSKSKLASQIAKGIILGTASVALLGAGGKFAYDVANEYTNRDTLCGSFKNAVEKTGRELGVSKEQSIYRKGVTKVVDFLKK